MLKALSIKSLLTAVLSAAASSLTRAPQRKTKRAPAIPFLPQLGNPVPVHTNPVRNAERKELRAMGRRQYIKAKKYRNASGR